jgi:putative transcriptional regulator
MGKRIQQPKYNRIKDVLMAQGKTQTWLAEKLDRDFMTVTRYCNNLRQPSIPTLFEIAKALKVNPKDLINF